MNEQRTFPGVIDPERELIAGRVIREAVEYSENGFLLKISVGELAQRVVVALSDAERPAPHESWRKHVEQCAEPSCRAYAATLRPEPTVWTDNDTDDEIPPHA